MEGSSTQEVRKHDEEEFLAEGRRAMACKEYEKATLAFQEACELMSAKYGQISTELGEPFFLYGKSLLELARVENTVLGGGVPVPQEEQVSDSEEDDEEEEGEGGQIEDEGSKEITADQEPLPSEKAVPGPSTSDDGNHVDSTTREDTAEQTAEETEEEPTNLQLAWEVLEVARVIYQKVETLDGKLRLADISLLLGEVSLESDQYERAIDDLTSCLKIRQSVLHPEDRLLAEAHFQLGLANTFIKSFDDAVAEYESAKQVLELRKEVLERKLDGANEDEATKISEEITELNELIPDINSKIGDVYEIKKESVAEVDSVTTGFGCNTAVVEGDEQTDIKNVAKPKESTEVTDISHLIRRKQVKMNGNHNQSKPEEAIESDQQEMKLSRKRVAEEEPVDNASAKRTAVDTTNKETCQVTEQ